MTRRGEGHKGLTQAGFLEKRGFDPGEQVRMLLHIRTCYVDCPSYCLIIDRLLLAIGLRERIPRTIAGMMVFHKIEEANRPQGTPDGSYTLQACSSS